MQCGTCLTLASWCWYFFSKSSFLSSRPCRSLMVCWATMRAGWVSDWPSSFLVRSASSRSRSAAAGRRRRSSLITLSLDKMFCSAVRRAASFSFNLYTSKYCWDKNLNHRKMTCFWKKSKYSASFNLLQVAWVSMMIRLSSFILVSANSSWWERGKDGSGKRLEPSSLWKTN